MDAQEATARLLDAAEAQFYARGIQAVGMDVLRAESGVSLKRLYQCFPSKERLVVAYLRRRDERWRARLAEYVRAAGNDPLAVFDWLHEWFREPGFRGCAFLNAFGELGAEAPGVAAAVREHKEAVLAYLRELTDRPDVDDPAALARQLLALVDGAIAVAATTGDPAAARTSRAAAATLLSAAVRA
ncbi:TetR/AcrR family transcriptional regulator [Amycolatopsis anabasis]|uniref:TetR/AcrR family transcriptional regulator n=1 Tax=Amycolatopsis anabasis TaxID=1840409 RepID=UPI00131E117F|nr:TetR/AcrR family transcriptional regulator [Amycolatopsis anabasis]